jgi:hypothetical protein
MVEPVESRAPASQQETPIAIRNAAGLLRIQAIIWALLAVGLVADGAANLALKPTKGLVTAMVVAVVVALAMGAFSAAKFRLASRLPHGTHQTRERVVAVETIMACFGGLVTLVLVASVFGLILSPAFIIGGIMSARVARGLTKPPAQQYFDAIEAEAAQSASAPPPDGGNPAQFHGILATA